MELTTQEKRRPYWQYLMNSTYDEIALVALAQGTIEGAWEKLIANQLYRDVYNDGNPQAFDLLKLTGDKKYNKETFYKAAVIILNSTP